jgi:hypothetical protein
MRTFTEFLANKNVLEAATPAPMPAPAPAPMPAPAPAPMPQQPMTAPQYSKGFYNFPAISDRQEIVRYYPIWKHVPGCKVKIPYEKMQDIMNKLIQSVEAVAMTVNSGTAANYKMQNVLDTATFGQDKSVILNVPKEAFSDYSHYGSSDDTLVAYIGELFGIITPNNQNLYNVDSKKLAYHLKLLNNHLQTRRRLGDVWNTAVGLKNQILQGHSKAPAIQTSSQNQS